MPQGALSGIRVLDFTRVLAGPLCTMMLADLGAEVIKVENPKLGDDTRHWGPPWGAGGISAYFGAVNRNKSSITLDLKQAEGRQIARQLAQKSQIVVENFKVGQMAEFGLDFATLQQENPALVYCSITGFGQTGSMSQYPGYDYIVQGMSGLMSITGETDGEPMKVGVAISDVIAGLYANSAILSALHHAQRTGIGQHIDIALLDTQIAALVNIASNTLISGRNAPRFGNQHPNIVPYQVFNAQDKPFILAVGNDRQFSLVCDAIGQSELARDPRFVTNPARVQHRAELIAILQQAFLERTADTWVQQCLDAGIPAGIVQTVEEALASQHVQERHLVQEATLATGEHYPFVASPIKLSHTPPQVTMPPPLLGEHTYEVLQRVLGLRSQHLSDAYSEDTI